jgi:hypothetical protein
MSNIGILLAIGSAVFNGSFAALFNMPKMVEVESQRDTPQKCPSGTKIK